MGHYIADRVMDLMGPEKENARVLVMGLTFKENVPDLRNTRVVDIIAKLRAKGHVVDVHDPMADTDEAARFYQIELKRSLDELAGYDAVVGAVPHAPYKTLAADVFQRLVKPGGLIADIKGMWRGIAMPQGAQVWSL